MRGFARNAVLVAGALFCVVLAVTALGAVLREGFGNIRVLALAGISLAIVGMILVGLVGAILNPPRD